jgi:DNA-binding XRE family transcriptional regulator
MVDPKIETAINTAPQVRGPFRTVFVKNDSSKEICKKLLTMTET